MALEVDTLTDVQDRHYTSKTALLIADIPLQSGAHSSGFSNGGNNSISHPSASLLYALAGETFLLQVALRRNKHLLALQAVNQGIRLVGAGHPEVHRMIVLLGKETASPSSSALNGHAKANFCT